MAKDIPIHQSSNEELVPEIDWTVSLLTGVTVTSVACTHTKPDGTTASDVTATVSSPKSYTKLPSGMAVGTHYVSNIATTSDPSLSPEVRFIIVVDY